MIRTSHSFQHARRRMLNVLMTGRKYRHQQQVAASSCLATANIVGPSNSRSRRRKQQYALSLNLATATATSSFHVSAVSMKNESSSVEDVAEESTTQASSSDDNSGIAPASSDIQYAFTPPPPLSDASKSKVESLFQRILWLDMIEIHLLTKLVEDKLGLTAGGSDFAEQGSSESSSGATAGEEDQSEQNLLKEVKLTGFDAKSKIKVIKEVRAIGELGLKEAKELVESAPKVVKKNLKPEQAEELKERLEAVGAQVDIV